jgi:DNA-3-methyladenine glycosylase
MFAAPGTLYVYRAYGIHWCANVACEPEGTGAAVLLRALEPTHGLDAMRARRGQAAARDLCSGPGKLTQALAITGQDDGAALGGSRFTLVPPVGAVEVVTTARIGITRAADMPWRYLIRETPWASRGPRSASP